MSLTIFGKIGAGILFSGSSTLIAVAIVDSELLGIYSNVHVYVISSKVTNGSTGINIDKKNYKCRFRDTSNSEKEDFECSIHKLKTQDKKQFDVSETIKKLNDVSTKTNFSETITDTDLAAENNVFQVTFSSRYWNKGKDNDKYTIEIIKSDEKGSDKFASLTQLFAIYQNKTNAKNTYFVVKSSSSNEINVESEDKCSFAESSENDKKLACKIFQFDKNETAKNDQKHTSLTFSKKTTTEAQKIEQYKHYLIQFTEDTSKLKNSNNEIVYWKKDDNAQKIKFEKIKQAFLTDKYDHIFIF